ncbi:MAG TPA: [FeFe] hydrogenase H-cluster maturation GTPase HydF [Candidatus Wallbacteria bacterium]|nr:[FeFe] hydrogenase H-cluster maturation GTPase HydF [Candidatus Wallbacteria bacterium]
MSQLNQTPTANRLHIAIFGKRNVGKSSLINAITNQNAAIVSDHAGTTTDPVYKAMEILPIGPVVLIDTAGIDDAGELGELRIKKTREVISKTDIALVVITPEGYTRFDEEIIAALKENETRFLIVINKIDMTTPDPDLIREMNDLGYTFAMVSALKKEGISELKNLIISTSPKNFEQPSIIGDLVKPGETVVLVIPIDTGMPKGRLILPQVQTIRDILDSDALAYVVKERELRWALSNMKQKPKLVVTDSQAFMKVSADTPPDILLTSFSILFARYKGDLMKLVNGAKTLKNLKPGDRVLISEACTHHQQPDDIGKVKIPRWIRQHIEEKVEFDFCSGHDYPENVTDYKLIVHCAGCVLNRKEMISRIDAAEIKGVPIINYGVTIAHIHGILDRALKPFPEVYQEWISNS